MKKDEKVIVNLEEVFKDDKLDKVDLLKIVGGFGELSANISGICQGVVAYSDTTYVRSVPFIPEKRKKD